MVNDNSNFVPNKDEVCLGDRAGSSSTNAVCRIFIHGSEPVSRYAPVSEI